MLDNLYEFGYHSYQAGKWQQATDAFRMFTIAQPRNVQGWLGLGASLYEDGQYNEAMYAFELAKKISVHETESVLASLFNNN